MSIDQNSCIGHFDAISQQCQQSFAWTFTDSITLDSFKKVCHYYSDSITTLDSLLNLSYSNSIASSRSNLGILLASTLEQQEIFLNNILTQQQLSIAPITLNNSTFISSVLHEELEKQVNDIYLNTFGKGIVDFDNLQLSTLRLIASYCPQEGGTAVHQAHAMLSMIEDVDALNFDCNSIQTKEIETDTKDKDETTSEWMVQLFPNPANTTLNIKSNELLLTGSTVKVYNSIGQIVYQQILTQEMQFIQIQVNELTDGIYFVEIQHQQKVHQEPFSVIKN